MVPGSVHILTVTITTTINNVHSVAGGELVTSRVGDGSRVRARPDCNHNNNNKQTMYIV